MDIRHSPAVVLLSALIVGAVACEAPPSDSSSGPVRSDSAGIEIVEYSSQTPMGFGGWVVQNEADLSIGTMDGPEEDQLFRISGAIRMANGQVVVANAGSGDLRFFDGQGNYLRSEGRRGGGPGEYERPSLVGRVAGDTMVVGDFQNNRVSFVHPEDGFQRSFQANETSSFGFTRGVLDDGTILRGGGITFSGGDELASGFQRDDVSYELADRTGHLIASLGEFPGPEMQVDVGEGFVSAMSVPFSRNTLAVAGGSRIVMGTNDDYTLREFAPTGELIRIVRSLEPPRPVTEAMLDAAFEERIADADDEDEVRRLRSARKDERSPTHLPAFQSILIDRAGLTWVEDYRTPLDSDPAWTVFDGAGEIVARLSTPPDLQLLDVGMDYVLGRVVDDFGVEYIRLHHLDRRPDAP